MHEILIIYVMNSWDFAEYSENMIGMHLGLVFYNVPSLVSYFQLILDFNIFFSSQKCIHINNLKACK